MKFEMQPGGGNNAESESEVVFNNFVNEASMRELQEEFGLTNSQLQNIIDGAPEHVGVPQDPTDIRGRINDYHREVRERLLNDGAKER